MRIAFVSQWYDPEVGSAAIPGAIVRALIARGHEVEVVTGLPNYPHGKLYEGYRVRPYARTVVRGVTVHRVPLYPSHDSSPIRRMFNFLSFMLSASTIGAVVARRAQVALVYSTPGTVGLVGVVLRRLLRRPFVLYIQDIWPDTLIATGMLPRRLIRPAEWILHRFCNQVYRAAAHIAVISPGMKALLVERGVTESKIDVVYNWVDEDLFRHVEATSGRRDTFQVMYAGNLGDVQGLDVAVRALAVAEMQDVVLRMVGTGVAEQRLRRLAAELGVGDRVWFEGSKSIAEMSAVMASADVQLVCLKDDPLFHLTMPSKIQAILAAGQPLITCAPGDAAELTRTSGAGWAVDAGDVTALAQAFREARDLPRRARVNMGLKGRRYYEERLAASVGSGMLEMALSKAVGGDGSG